MLFSERLRLEEEFLEWAKAHGAANCPMNVIAWLGTKGMLKDTPCRADALPPADVMAGAIGDAMAMAKSVKVLKTLLADYPATPPELPDAEPIPEAAFRSITGQQVYEEMERRYAEPSHIVEVENGIQSD